MIKAGFSDDKIDPILRKKLVPSLKDYIGTSDDDYLLIAIGDTGTGKSSLFLHILEQYLGEKLTENLIGLDKQQIADALQSASKMDHPRGWLCDEANFSKRDSMTKFNKELIDMYLSIRGLNILHLWCNPTLDMIDKFFVEEKIKGVFLCTSKIDGKRPYYFFEKNAILQILNKYKDLKISTISKVKKKYASYKGWYEKYDGPLNKRYLEIKQKRMQAKIDGFQEKWGTSEWIKATDVAKEMGRSSTTLTRYLKELSKQEKMKEGVDWKWSGTLKLFHKDSIAKLKAYQKEISKVWTKNLKKVHDKIRNTDNNDYRLFQEA